MTFTKLGGTLAWIAMAFGCFGLLATVITGLSMLPPPTATVFGPKLIEGALVIFLGVSLGLLVEISRSLATRKDGKNF